MKNLENTFGGMESENDNEKKENFELDIDKGMEKQKSREKDPTEEVIDLLDEINNVDRKIFAAQGSVSKTEKELSALRENFGLPVNNEKPPSLAIQGAKIDKLRERRKELSELIEVWIGENGRDNIPDGVAIEGEEGGWEVKGGNLEDYIGEQESDYELDKEVREKILELRVKWLKEWSGRAVEHFRKFVEEHWKMKNAVNLSLIKKLIELRVPKILKEKTQDYIEGKIDKSTISTVWLNCDVSPLTDETEFINKIEITTSNEKIEVANADELEKELKKENPAGVVEEDKKLTTEKIQ